MYLKLVHGSIYILNCLMYVCDSILNKMFIFLFHAESIQNPLLDVFKDEMVASCNSLVKAVIHRALHPETNAVYFYFVHTSWHLS